MGRLLAVLIAFGVLFAAYYVIDNMKSSYEWIPVDTKMANNQDPVKNWTNYLANNGKFVVSMPITPQYASQSVPIPNSKLLRKYDMYVAQTLDGDIFTISAITYPENFSVNSDEVMRSIVNEVQASNPENKVIEMTAKDFDGDPGYNFVVENSNTYIKGREFFNGQTLYVLTMIDNGKDANPIEYKHFVESFSLFNNAVNQKNNEKSK